MDVDVPGGYRTFIVLMNSFFYSRQTDIPCRHGLVQNLDKAAPH